MKIYYDCRHAKEASKGLCEYITAELGIEAAFEDIKHEWDNEARKTKTIFIGHHSDTKKRLKEVKLRYEKYGMRYGYAKNTCVLTASKSELGGSKDEFMDEYNDVFDYGGDEYIRAMQFRFVVRELVDSGLDEYLNM